MEDNDYKARQEMLRELNQMLDAEMAKPITERDYDRIEELLHSYADVIGIRIDECRIFMYIMFSNTTKHERKTTKHENAIDITS